MTLEQLLDTRNYPYTAEIVAELKKVIRDPSKTHTAEGMKASCLLDEIKHLAVAALSYKELPE